MWSSSCLSKPLMNRCEQDNHLSVDDFVPMCNTRSINACHAPCTSASPQTSPFTFTGLLVMDFITQDSLHSLIITVYTHTCTPSSTPFIFSTQPFMCVRSSCKLLHILCYRLALTTQPLLSFVCR